ncbi:Protein downstream neighbor of Son [Halotydeus destructor]|nr:Protein downstream neighbor of Son [Halotydeus destructor]
MNRRNSSAKKKEAPLAAASPQFVKPFEVFLMRKRKPKTPSKKPMFSPLKCLSSNSPFKSSKSPKQRKTPIKHAQIENYFTSPLSGKSSRLPSKSPSKITPTKTSKRQLNFGLAPCITIDDETNLEAPMKRARLGDDNPFDSKMKDLASLPLDWSLKTRVRFTSSKPFPWRGNFRASEDATGTTSFVRCLYAVNEDEKPVAAGEVPSFLSSQSQTFTNNSNSCPSPSNRRQPLDTSLSAVLRQNSYVWIHPHLPWLSLYPRINVAHKTSAKSTFQIDAQSPVAESLMSDWILSIRSLYNLVKTRHCPYFYMCAPTFTVLFRSAGIAGFDDIHAIITPTTSGFRNLLKKESIAFDLPFSSQPVDSKLMEETTQASDLSSNETSSAPVNECDHELDLEDEPSQFLESLGLSQQDFPSLASTRMKTTKEKGSSKQESLAIITGSDTQLLVSFFCSHSRVIVSNTGALCGVPPTLLSPVSFHGGTLQALKLKQTQNVYNDEKVHSLDICGPLLPSAVKGLCDFFRQTQDGNYRLNLITHEPTSNFAKASQVGTQGSCFSVFATESLRDCGLPLDLVRACCSRDEHCRETIGDVMLKNHLYSIR